MAIFGLMLLVVIVFATLSGVIAGRSSAELRPAQRTDSIYGIMRTDGQLHRRGGDVFGKHEWFIEMLRNRVDENPHWARLISRTAFNNACAGRIEVRSQFADRLLTGLVAIGSALPILAHFGTFWDMWTEYSWDTGRLYGYTRALSAAAGLAVVGAIIFWQFRTYFEKKSVEKLFRDFLFGNNPAQLAFYEKEVPWQKDRIHGANPVQNQNNSNSKVG